MDSFTYAFRKFPSLFVLTLVASVLVEPLMFLVLQVTGSFAEFSLFAQSGLSTDYTIASILKILLGVLIILVAVLLSCCFLH
jgi:cation transporter-like permease